MKTNSRDNQFFKQHVRTRSDNNFRIKMLEGRYINEGIIIIKELGCKPDNIDELIEQRLRAQHIEFIKPSF